MPRRKRKAAASLPGATLKALKTGEEIVAARVKGKGKDPKTPLQLLDSSVEAVVEQKTKTKKDTAYRQVVFALLYTFVGTDGAQPGLGDTSLYLLIADFVLDARDTGWLIRLYLNGNRCVLTPVDLAPSRYKKLPRVFAYRQIVANGYPVPEKCAGDACTKSLCGECAHSCEAVCGGNKGQDGCEMCPCQAELDSREGHWCSEDKRVFAYTVLFGSERPSFGKNETRADRYNLLASIRDENKGPVHARLQLQDVHGTGGAFLNSVSVDFSSEQQIHLRGGKDRYEGLPDYRDWDLPVSTETAARASPTSAPSCVVA